jgi:hypothetical protein
VEAENPRAEGTVMTRKRKFKKGKFPKGSLAAEREQGIDDYFKKARDRDIESRLKKLFTPREGEPSFTEILLAAASVAITILIICLLW